MVNEDGVKKRKLTGARNYITKDGMRGWTWDPKRDGYYIAKGDFPEKFMDKFVPFLKGLRNEHCELDMWANSKNRLFIRWVGEKTKDKHWWHKLSINGSPANHEMASFARESFKEFVEEIEKFIEKSDLADVIQVNPNWRFWEDDCKDKSCNIGGKVGSINFLSELEPEQVKNFYDNMDTYAMLESRKVNESRKIVKEADEGYDSDTPKIYVGTYAKYNNGSIDGKWIDLSDYNTYEEFVDACRELHSDEDDPEFMVQDYENFPEKWYHEGGLPTEEEFDKINEYYMMDDSKKEAYEVFVNYTGLDSIEDFDEAYEGQFDTPEDFGYYCVENFGMPSNPEYYIDYESFGRDLTMDWHRGDPDEEDYEGEPEDPDYYYDDESHEQQMPYGSDSEVGEQYVDDVGIENMGKNFLDNYFDYEEYGRTLLINDFWEDSGYIFREI